MVLTDLLKHPKELFYKKIFILFSVMLFFAVPLLRDLTDLTALMSNPIFQRFQYPPHLVFFIFFTLSWTFTALITYFMISHATTKNKTGILTFFAFSQSVRLSSTLCLYFLLLRGPHLHISPNFFSKILTFSV